MTHGRPRYRPEMTQSGRPPTYPVSAVDERGAERSVTIAGEFPLTIYLDKREIVTLMTLGGHPEMLTLGYLRNQRLIEALEDIVSVQVDWDVESVAVTTTVPPDSWVDRLAHRTVTTGCGQGTVFGDVLAELGELSLPPVTLKQSILYELLRNLNAFNEVYKSAGAVHGCALCKGGDILTFIEDVGRHNAVDAIAGSMWLEDIRGADKLFYTTGRLTSEMVIKVAQMGIPVLLSRSGVTRMGLDLARRIGLILIGRAKGRHFLVFNGSNRIEFDAMDN
jgi:FdhD protein